MYVSNVTSRFNLNVNERHTVVRHVYQRSA